MTELQLDAPSCSGVITNPIAGRQDESASQQSQTASEYIDTQLQLEADARDALPYNFDHCTRPLGALRQSLFSCLTCNPPPVFDSDEHTAAAVCYSCSIACHGEHTLVELFNRRNFVCDCGTTRIPPASPCTLRINPETGLKGPVHSQEPAAGNTYNKNFKNRFCACGEWYDAHQEKGTMFQCLGLATEADGGCGEDWWHPECIMGLGRETTKAPVKSETNIAGGGDEDAHGTERPLPAGFPPEDDFETFICYKCIDSNPWIKQYAGTRGFLPAVLKSGHPVLPDLRETQNGTQRQTAEASSTDAANSPPKTLSSPKKRSADEAELDKPSNEPKKAKAEESQTSNSAYHASLPPPPDGQFSLFLREDFREHFCRCRDCYPILSKHSQLLEEEETYEPPLSESGDGEANGSKGTGSLLDRGEAALSNVDRVRAIEGVMVYNHLKDKVKAFLQPFAESGQPVGAEDIKAYFEQLRGDEQGIREAGAARADDGGGGEGDHRREQSGC